MSENRLKGRGPGHESDSDDKTSYESALRERHNRLVPPAGGNESNGWEAYRRWMTRVQAPEKRRATLDPSLYTWKGYRNWSEKIRRDWDRD